MSLFLRKKLGDRETKEVERPTEFDRRLGALGSFRESAKWAG